MKLQDLLQSEINIADKLDEDQLVKIGADAVQGFDIDLSSREHWEQDVKHYLKLAMQIKEAKTFPWPGASNVKYPIISTVAMQFAARAYPTLVPSNGNVVQVAITGKDPEGKKDARAGRVSKYMSYQIFHEMHDWEENMDMLLLILPIYGIGFKKIYYDSVIKQNVAKLVNPYNLVTNYWTKDLCNAERVSEVIYRSKREIIEKQRAGLYLDVDLGEPTIQDNFKEAINVSKNLEPNGDGGDQFVPYMLIEQHTYLDLDEDGYTEPYIILLDYNTRKVLRITPRYTEDDIEFNEKGQVQRIKPTNYFVKYPFIPSPDGSFYTRGFGHLLGPLNESINTILNQLIDAGTLATTQGGFIGKGLKLRSGNMSFRVGEWKEVNALGGDIKNNIFPLPVREPSATLFQLLGMLIQSTKELASVAEIFVGKMPGQNTPAYTTQQTIEQGMKLFTAIYKRVYRSMTEEFKMLYCLNRYYLDESDYKTVTDDPEATQQDFEEDSKDISPTADPSASSDFDKQQKYQQAGNLLKLGTINPVPFTEDMLKTYNFEDTDIQRWMQGSPASQPKQPSPEQQSAQIAQQQAQQKMQSDQASAQLKIQVEQAKFALKKAEAELDMAVKQQAATTGMKEAQIKQVQQAAELQHQQVKGQLDIMATAAKNDQDIKHQSAMNTVKQQQAKQPKPKKGA